MFTACRHTLDLAFDNIIQCAVVSHLSLLNLPDDLEVTHIILVALSLHTWVTVLGDLSNPLVKTGNEGSSLASVEFFLEHLRAAWSRCCRRYNSISNTMIIKNILVLLHFATEALILSGGKA